MATPYNPLNRLSVHILFIFTLIVTLAYNLTATADSLDQPIEILQWSELNQFSKTELTTHPKASDTPSETNAPNNEHFPSLPDLGHFANYERGSWRYTSPSTQTSTDSTPPDKRSQQGRLIKIPGFIVPVEYEQHDGNQKVSAFFLVPKFGAILFEAAPPQNQIIYVQLVDPHSLEAITEAYWVTGTLQSKRLTKLGTTARYSMKAHSIERYTPTRDQN